MSKIALSGNASGTGTLTIAAPNTSTNRTLTLPDNTGTIVTSASSIAASQLPAGSVLQVLQSFKTDTYSQTSKSFTVITGLTISITPTTATSKIFVMAQIGCSSLVAQDSWYFAVGKNGSVITASTGDSAGSRPRATVVSQQADGSVTANNYQQTIPIMFLDAPATTSAITYSVMGRTANGNTLYINRTQSDRDTADYDGRWTSSITVMEIAA